MQASKRRARLRQPTHAKQGHPRLYASSGAVAPYARGLSVFIGVAIGTPALDWFSVGPTAIVTIRPRSAIVKATPREAGAGAQPASEPARFMARARSRSPGACPRPAPARS